MGDIKLVLFQNNYHSPALCLFCHMHGLPTFNYTKIFTIFATMFQICHNYLSE